MTKKCTVSKVAYILAVVGALNWGLVGVAGLIGDGNWNVVNLLLGSWPVVENIVYVLVGLSGIVLLKGCKCATCKDGMCENCGGGAGNCKSGNCSGDMKKEEAAM